MDLGREEKCEFLPFLCPQRVLYNEKGHIIGMEFTRTFQDDNDEWKVDEEQVTRIKADYIISAFGCKLADSDGIYFDKLKIL